jgi:hypothetical protein
MFKISTAFIKGQIPGVTLDQLIRIYKRKLEDQSVSRISVNNGIIYFSNDSFKIVLTRYSNKFSSFSNGSIKITDTETEFVVCLQASLTRLFISAAFIAGIPTLFLLLSAGLNIFPLVVGLVIFSLLLIVGYISANISFPVYFTGLRNDIERELQGIQ